MSKQIVLNSSGAAEIAIWRDAHDLFIQKLGGTQLSVSIWLLPELIKQLQKIKTQTTTLPPTRSEAQEIEKVFIETRAKGLQWGLKEIRLRKQDLSNKTEDGLKIAKMAAKSRREAAGLTEEQAVQWMKAARKELEDNLAEAEEKVTQNRDVPATNEAIW